MRVVLWCGLALVVGLVVMGVAPDVSRYIRIRRM
jgi:hypothetical protein